MLNGPVSAHRRISFGSLPLETVKMIKDAYRRQGQRRGRRPVDGRAS